MRSPVEPRYRLPLLLLGLTLLAAAAYLPLLGYLPLYLEEPRRALVAAEMLATGEYLIPIHAGEPYYGKPPLVNWLILLASLPAGRVGEVSARLPSVLAVWLLTLFLVASNWRRLGAAGSLFLGCALLLNPEFLLKGQLAEIDAVFSALVASSVWTWFLLDQAGRRGLLLWLPPLLLVALGFLAKREPALVFFYLAVGPYLLLRGRGRELLGPGHALALILAAMPVLGWLATLAGRVGWEALGQSLVQEVLTRGQRGGLARYLGHVLTYPLQVWGANLPFALLLLPLASRSLRRAVRDRYGEALPFAGLAVLANLPLYWFKGDLAVRYFLPMFPFLALLAALVFGTLAAEPAGGRWGRPLAWGARWLYGALALLVLTLGASPYLRPDPAPPWDGSLTLGLALGTGVLVWGLRSWVRERPLALLLPAMTLAMLLVRGLYFQLYLPHKAQSLARGQNAPAIAAEVLRQTPAGRPLFVSRWVPSAVWFYAPRGSLVLISDGAVLRAGDRLLRHSLLGAWPGLAPELVLEPLARFRYEDDELLLEAVRRPRAADLD